MTMTTAQHSMSHPKFGRCDACGEPPLIDHLNEGQLIPLKACSRCHQVFYHSVDCQRKHYAVHKPACRRHVQQQEQQRQKESAIQSSSMPLPMTRVEQTPDKGRCLIAQHDIRHGETVQFPTKMDDSPFSTKAKCLVPPVLLESTRASHCAVCFRELLSSSLSSSSRPPSPFEFHTCSSDCHHSSIDYGLVEEAHVARRVLANGRIPRIFPTALLVFRLLRATTLPKNNNQSSSLSTTAAESCSPSLGLGRDWSTVMDMVGVSDSQSQIDNDAAAAHEQAILWTVMALWNETNQVSTRASMTSTLSQSTLVSRIQQALARVKANAFSIVAQSPQYENGQQVPLVLGTALFESPAYLVNHCCLTPNCLQTFRTGTLGSFPTLSLVANRFIASGEELTIAYCDFPSHDAQKDCTLQRQAVLRESYYFTCRCQVCASS